MEAQIKVSSPGGEYYLRGVMETACGFKLNADSTFEFFFTYGALDRIGKGRWKTENNTIVLTSGSKPLHDFALVRSAQGDTSKISIRIIEGNELLLRYVHCKLKGGGKEQEGITNEKGVVELATQPLETIELSFEFCLEKKSIFTIDQKNHRGFEFKPEPWLMEVFFHNFSLTRTKDGLSGGHPLADGTSFRYEKRKSSKM